MDLIEAKTIETIEWPVVIIVELENLMNSSDKIVIKGKEYSIE